MRGDWAEIDVNLRTDVPGPEAIRDGVNKILTRSSFKTRCVEIQHENEELNAVAQLEKIINEVK